MAGSLDCSTVERDRVEGNHRSGLEMIVRELFIENLGLRVLAREATGESM
jgi:hypothetical protein